MTPPLPCPRTHGSQWGSEALGPVEGRGWNQKEDQRVAFLTAQPTRVCTRQDDSWRGTGDVVLGLLHRVLGLLHRVPGLLHRVLGLLHRVLGLLHRVLAVQ